MAAHFGFVRVAAAVPPLALADPATNAWRTLDLLSEAESQRVAVIVFPELGLTGYTCHDLFHQPTLLSALSLSWNGWRPAPPHSSPALPSSVCRLWWMIRYSIRQR